MRHPLLLLCSAATLSHAYTIAQPPLPPSVNRGKGTGGDGDNSMLFTTIEGVERRATLSLWKWQAEEVEARHAPPTESSSALLSTMMAWSRDDAAEEKEEEWWQKMMPKQLRGQSLAARLDEDTLAIILLHYELDKSSLQTCLEGRQLLVIDSIALTPSITSSQCRVLLMAGIRETLADMASGRSMRLQFQPHD